MTCLQYLSYLKGSNDHAYGEKCINCINCLQVRLVTFISNIAIEFTAYHHVPMANSMLWLTTQKEINPRAYLFTSCTISWDEHVNILNQNTLNSAVIMVLF